MWYRAKFGFKAISDVEIVIKVGEVSVEVRMLDPSSLLSTVSCISLTRVILLSASHRTTRMLGYV